MLLVSVQVSNLLFCLTTGQLDAWWELIRPHECSAPAPQNVPWKYPACDTNFTAGSRARGSKPGGGRGWNRAVLEKQNETKRKERKPNKQTNKQTKCGFFPCEA